MEAAKDLGRIVVKVYGTTKPNGTTWTKEPSPVPAAREISAKVVEAEEISHVTW